MLPKTANNFFKMKKGLYVRPGQKNGLRNKYLRSMNIINAYGKLWEPRKSANMNWEANEKKDKSNLSEERGSRGPADTGYRPGMGIMYG